MSDRELIFEFINRLSTGSEKQEPITSDILKIPIRYSNLHFTSSDSLWLGAKHKFTSFSSDTPSTLFTLFKDYPDLPKDLGDPPSNRKITGSCYVLREDLVKCMSNAYLYKGYVEPRLLDDLMSYMKGETRHVVANWIKFNESPRWTNSFPFKLPRFLEDIPESRFELKLLKHKNSRKIPLKNICILTALEFAVFSSTEDEIYRRNAMYFLLLRELFENE